MSVTSSITDLLSFPSLRKGDVFTSLFYFFFSFLSFVFSAEVYTKDGNSYGKPCEFPFLYNKVWHHDCIQDETHTGGKWCATSEDYSRDGKWGICLQPGTLGF